MSAVMGVLAAAVITAVALNNDPSTAGVGDCLSGTSATSMKIRSCGDPKATYKVVKVANGMASDDAESACDGTNATRYFFDSGTVLCLQNY